MIKKTKRKRKKRTKKPWSPEARDRLHKRIETLYESEAVCPSEDMIYNVLCPQIRATWTEAEHTRRIAPAYRDIAVELLELEDPLPRSFNMSHQ
jgi:hypothetical protein